MSVQSIQPPIATTAVLATPAAADTRKCYTAHVGNIPTTQQCIYLPVDVSPRS